MTAVFLKLPRASPAFFPCFSKASSREQELVQILKRYNQTIVAILISHSRETCAPQFSLGTLSFVGPESN
jgi:hypothetical protein